MISSSRQHGFRLLEENSTFNLAAPSVFFNDNEMMLYILGFLNSKFCEEILSILNPTLNTNISDITSQPLVYNAKAQGEYVIRIVKANLNLSHGDWDAFETSWDFETHPLLNCRVEAEREIPVVRGNEDGTYLDTGTEVYVSLENAYKHWQQVCNASFTKLKSNEEELNRIFIEIYGLQDELTPDVAEKDVTVHYIADTKETAPEGLRNSNYLLTKKDVVISLLSYAVGCMFGRYSLDTPGLAYAGGEWEAGKYTSFIPDQDNILPITDEEYFPDDITGLFCAWLKKAYGTDTLEENIDFIADALGGRGKTSREVIHNYFINDFYQDHCKTYKKRPIYWLFDSGKQNGFKALIYMHRYNEDTIGNLRVDYLHRMERVYENELTRMQDIIANSADARDVATATKRKEKLQKQLKECKDYDEKIAHLALARIAIDLDDGVKVNYEKVQTGADGKKYEVLGKV